MKHQIQARLAKEFEGMSEDEIRAGQERRIEAERQTAEPAPFD